MKKYIMKNIHNFRIVFELLLIKLILCFEIYNVFINEFYNNTITFYFFECVGIVVLFIFWIRTFKYIIKGNNKYVTKTRCLDNFIKKLQKNNIGLYILVLGLVLKLTFYSISSFVMYLYIILKLININNSKK